VKIIKKQNCLKCKFIHIAEFVFCVFALIFFMTEISSAAEQKSFETPEAAVSALINAMKSNDKSAMHSLFGSEGSKLASSGDALDDAHDRAEFIKAYNEASKVVLDGNDQATILLGKDEWPMPIPLVKSSVGWHFDTEKGKDEILKRRIGRNELSAIQVCLAIVDAEREYAASHLDSEGVPVYATKLSSTAGKQDGLYWPTQDNEALSPLGAFLAAADEGFKRKGMMRHHPYHGYYYRILSHGEDAPDGTQNYLIKGKMIGGFAVIAYPARYGATGVKSFLVNHAGVIYERDLGQNTKALASAIITFSPGSDWVLVDQKKKD